MRKRECIGILNIWIHGGLVLMTLSVVPFCMVSGVSLEAGMVALGIGVLIGKASIKIAEKRIGIKADGVVDVEITHENGNLGIRPKELMVKVNIPDKMDNAKELINYMLIEYNERGDIMYKLREFTRRLMGTDIKDLYNDSSKVELYFNLLQRLKGDWQT